MKSSPKASAPTQAAIYLRISLDHTGEGLAVERQREACQQIAEQRNWDIVAEYVDNSISASDARKQRPGYDDLIQGWNAGNFEAIICYDLDRLTRQPRQLEDWIDRATERGLQLVTANGEADLTTDGGRMFARIKASVARAEVERKSARQTAANAQRAKQGRPPLGTRLTGYTTKGEVIESEAGIVRTIFDHFNAGNSLKGIARELTEQGNVTRHGKPWNYSTVKGILENPRYAGLAIYQGKETGVQGNWEPIVTESDYRLANARLDDPQRKTNAVGTDRKYLGSGLFKCGNCGNALRSFSNNRYRCHICRFSRDRDNVDGVVLEAVNGRLAMQDLRDILPAKNTEAHKTLDTTAKDLHARLETIGQDYDAGLIDGQRYSIAREKVLAELEALDRERIRLVGRAHGETEKILTSEDPAKAFEAAPLMIRRSVIDFFFTVSVFPGKRGSKIFDPRSVVIDWK